MDLEDGFTTCEVRQLHGNTAVKAAGAGQRRVKGLRAVGRRQNDDAVVAFKAVHLGQKLVKRLFTLIVAAYLTIALLPMASISSIKTIQGAFSLACLNRSRTFDAPIPTNISTNSEPDMEKTEHRLRLQQP